MTKPCFVGEGFTRKPPKFERFIRPMVRLVRVHSFFDHLISLGTAFHQSARHSSRTESDLSAAHHRREEEPQLAALHLARCDHQGYRSRSKPSASPVIERPSLSFCTGQRQRARHGHPRWKSRLGKVRPSDEPSRKRRLHQRRTSRLIFSLFSITIIQRIAVDRCELNLSRSANIDFDRSRLLQPEPSHAHGTKHGRAVRDAFSEDLF